MSFSELDVRRAIARVGVSHPTLNGTVLADLLVSELGSEHKGPTQVPAIPAYGEYLVKAAATRGMCRFGIEGLQPITLLMSFCVSNMLVAESTGNQAMLRAMFYNIRVIMPWLIWEDGQLGMFDKLRRLAGDDGWVPEEARTNPETVWSSTLLQQTIQTLRQSAERRQMSIGVPLLICDIQGDVIYVTN